MTLDLSRPRIRPLCRFEVPDDIRYEATLFAVQLGFDLERRQIEDPERPRALAPIRQAVLFLFWSTDRRIALHKIARLGGFDRVTVREAFQACTKRMAIDDIFRARVCRSARILRDTLRELRAPAELSEAA